MSIAVCVFCVCVCMCASGERASVVFIAGLHALALMSEKER